MYRYITKNRGLYALYAVFLIISSTMSVFFAFVLSEILNCAVEGNLGKLQKVLVFGIIFLIAAVLSEFLYGVVKNRLVCLARLDLKRDLFDCILHRKTTDFESRNTGDYMNELLNNLNMYESLYFENILQIPIFHRASCQTHRKTAGKKHRHFRGAVRGLFRRDQGRFQRIPHNLR
jgi:ABC-type multidrug transport system fused ATPase/permease subunit